MAREMQTPHIRTKRVIDPIRAGGGLNAHHLIAETAVMMANELFEVYAMENAIYARLRADGRVTEKEARKLFVARTAPRLLEDARQVLTSCLGESDDVCPTTMKDKIAAALIADNDLRAKRMVTENQMILAAAQANGPRH